MIFVDPVGGGKLFADLPKPDLVLLLHLHSVPFELTTLDAIVPVNAQSTIITPSTVAKKIPGAVRGKTNVNTPLIQRNSDCPLIQ
jgi:hypothetical protein